MDTLAGIALIIARLFMYIAAWFWKGMFKAVGDDPKLMMTAAVTVYISIFIIDRLRHPEDKKLKRKPDKPENMPKDTKNDRILSEYTLD